MDICTIIAKNYVAHARVLARSFVEHHPEGRCFVLVIDEFDDYLEPSAEPFTILTPEQIGCGEFQEMALRYDVLELSTAVKPWLLRHLLREETSVITYLDPDIRIYSSLQRLDELARERGLVLIPHNAEPLPDDGERPEQIDILRAGVYNLGYVSLGAREDIFMLLDWWERRLLNDCRVDPLEGYFVDQRWFDLAPGFVSDRAIVRDPQYNAAYWNLSMRRLGRNGRGYTIDEQPLAFFHFSGFNPERPDILSRHQSRVKVSDNSVLEQICIDYAKDVISAGHLEVKDWPYTYDLLPSGIQFSRSLRQLHAIALERGEVDGSPFTQEGSESFLQWLAMPAPGAPLGVNRLLAELYGTRRDLQEAFPDVAGADRQPLLRWARERGVIDEPALALLPMSEVEDSSPQSASVPVTGSPPPADVSPGDTAAVGPPERRSVGWGVNVVGYFRSELGKGEAARQVMNALDAHGVPVLPIHGPTIPASRQGHPYTYLDHGQARFPVNLICMNADVLDEFATQVGPSFFHSRYTIGMWAWEVERFPERWISAFDHVDELWLESEHIVRAVSPLSSVPIVKITIPVEMPPVVPRGRSDLGLPDGFLFQFSFDYHSVFRRKNPLALIDAYTRAFGSEDGAALVIRCINSPSDPVNHKRLLAASRDRPDIQVMDGYVTPGVKNSMVAACDCYVSLHRAEGFGLTMAEAMYLGKPVIATGYSGNLDFMTTENSFLVKHRLVPIGPEAAPYPSDGEWAEPDVDHAAELMREVFERREYSSERGRRAAEDIRQTHSAASAGAILARRLEHLRERHGARLLTPSDPDRLPEKLVEQVEAGPLTRARSRLGPLGKLVRRIVLRAIKPFTAYQQSVNADIARSLRQLEIQADIRDEAAFDDRVTLLAELRGHARVIPPSDLVEGLTSSVKEITRSVEWLVRSMHELETTMPELQQAIGGAHQLSERVDTLDRSVKRLVWEDQAIPYMDGSPFATGHHPVAGLVQGYAYAEDSSTHPYRSFEDTFRGSEELIRARQRPYLEIVNGRQPVLDLGCGRGEFLDLLRDAGLDYLGVDLDGGMVARCHEKGHAGVVHGDGLEFLEQLDNHSLGAVFTAQVVEHLSYEQLLRLLTLARTKLRDDGLLIAETVNPHSTPALKTFWVDLTHEQPIFPEVALALCRDAGFASAYVFHPGASGNVERDRFTEGAYAVVANPTEPMETLQQP